MISLGIVASAVVNSALLLVGRGGFGHSFVTMVIAVYLGIPLIVIGWIVVGPVARRSGQITALAGAVCISGVISLAPGRWMAQHDIAAAKRYCDALILQVDEYEREHGSYPHDLSLLRRDPDVPHLARSLSYWSDGSGFGFDMGDPRGIMNFISYTSANRQWREWH
jgi:hypothetical protein